MTGRQRDVTLLRRVAVAGALVVSLVLLTASPAAAHATLVSTSPEPGALLDVAPARASITFDEPVQIESDSLVVIDAESDVISAEPNVEGTTISVTLPTDVTGWFAVSWHAISIDGHPLSGGWTYRVGEGADTAPDALIDQADAGSVAGPAVRIGWTLTQWASTLAALTLLGTAFVVAVTTPVEAQRRLVVVTGVVGTIASLVAAEMNGALVGAGGGTFGGPASTEYLARTVLMAVGANVLWASWERRSLAHRLIPSVLAAAALCVTVLSGHADADGPATVAVVMAHLVVAGCWLGAVPAVLIAVLSGGAPAGEVLARFSRAAGWLLLAVLVLGGAGAWMISGGPASVAPRWGAVFIGKVALVVIAALAGGWTRFNVLPGFASRRPVEVRAPLVVESLLLVAIVAASIALLHNGPPQEVVASDGPVVLSMTSDDIVVSATIDPATLGTNDIHVFVTEPSGALAPVEEVVVELSSEELGIASITQELSELAPGHYSGRTEDLGAAGTWQIRVTVRPDTFTQVELEGELDVG